MDAHVGLRWNGLTSRFGFGAFLLTRVQFNDARRAGTRARELNRSHGA